MAVTPTMPASLYPQTARRGLAATRWLALPFAASLVPALLLGLPHDWRFLPLHAAALGVVVALAWRGPILDRAVDDKPALRWCLLAGGAALVTWVLFGESPRATWGIIDDHCIHRLIGPDRDRFPAGEILSSLAVHPEAGAPGTGQTRYRPAYYALYHAQAAAWGKQPQPWFVARLVAFCFAATLGFDLLRQWLGMVGAATAVAVFAALWMWPEIVCQLGSGETYAMPALALFAWCAVDIVRGTGARTGLAWLGMTIASLVAIGSKENFVVLAPLTLVVAAVEWRRGDLRWPAVAGCLVTAAAAAAVAGVVAVGIANNGGRDVYHRPVGLMGLLSSGDAASRRTLRKLAVYGIPLAAAAAGTAIAWLRLRTVPGASRTREKLLAAFVLLLVALSQVAFYRGDVFKKCRYDLPFVPIVCVLLVGLLVETVSRWRPGSQSARRVLRRLVVPGTLAVAALTLGGDHSRAATHAYVVATNNFLGTIHRVAADCRSDPGRPVTFHLTDNAVADYEPVFSVATYLRSFGISNPLYLSPAGLPVDADPSRSSFQGRGLLALSRDGDAAFTPWQQLAPDAAPIELWFSADPPPGRSPAYRFR